MPQWRSQCGASARINFTNKTLRYLGYLSDFTKLTHSK